jgi:hypothetical protein
MRVLTILAVLLLCTMVYSQTPVKNSTIPVDRNGKPVSVEYFWDDPSSTFKPVGSGTAVFDRMDCQYVTDVSTDLGSASALNLTSTFEGSGVVVRNFSTNYMKVWFDMASNPTGASAPDTFWVPSGGSTYFPLKADSVYIVESATAPNVQVEQGRVD